MKGKPGKTPGNPGELEELRRRLAEAEEVLNAIRRGEVDALVVNTDRGDQIFTLRNAERPYRIMVEQMNEGALTISAEDTILYCNPRFAQMVKLPPDKLLLASISKYIAPESLTQFEALRRQNRHGEIILLTEDQKQVHTHFALRTLALDDNLHVYCVVVTDLTEHKQLGIEREKLAMKLLEVQEKERLLAEKRGETTKAPESLEELHSRLEEAEQTVDAIRSGQVDALVVNTEKGDQVFTFKSPERHYRIIVEQMNAGALTLSQEGNILYGNQRFAQMVKLPLEQILGTSIYDYLAPERRAQYRTLVERNERGRVSLVAGDQTTVPTYFALNTLTLEDNVVVHVAVVTDLTEEKPNRI